MASKSGTAPLRAISVFPPVVEYTGYETGTVYNTVLTIKVRCLPCLLWRQRDAFSLLINLRAYFSTILARTASLDANMRPSLGPDVPPSLVDIPPHVCPLPLPLGDFSAFLEPIILIRLRSTDQFPGSSQRCHARTVSAGFPLPAPPLG